MRSRTLAAIAIGLTVVFVSLAVLERTGKVAPVDTAIMRAVHEVSSPAIVHVALALTILGTFPSVVVPILAILIWAIMRRERRMAILFGIVCLANGPVNMLMKHGFQRIRPELWPRVEMASYSFPSGHAQSSIALFGIMAVVAARLRPSTSSALTLAAPLWAFGVGASRVILGVHWPSDVVAGWSLGGILLILGVVGLRYGR